MAAYVISQWHASNTPDNEGNLVNIRGRAPGIVSWILSVLGVEPKVHLKVDGKHVRFEQGSIGGSSTLVIQLCAVTSTIYGYTKPWAQALGVFAGITFAGGPVCAMQLQSFGLGFIAAAGIGFVIASIYYSLKQEMSIGLVDESGNTSTIMFKASVIEGQKLGEEQAAHASSIIQWVCDNSRGHSGS